MADINVALKFTLKNEGGYSNVPEDHGGPTNFGITQADFTEFLGRQASAEDVKDMTVSQATSIYKHKYWDVLDLDNCHSQACATAIFDMGVLCGVHTSAKWAQSILGVTADGRIGAMTIGMLNQTAASVFITKFANRAQSYFDSIVMANSSQHRFLAGWTNRVIRLRNLTDVPAGNPDTTQVPGDFASKVLNAFDVVECRTQAARLISFLAGKTPGYLTIFDISKDANAKRLHILDTANWTCTSITCGVGKGSDPDGDGKATHFSDQEGSGETSLGVFKYSELSHMSDGRPCIRLDGLEASNAHMRARAILFHPAPYVSDTHAGRSLGCEAIAPDNVKFVSALANNAYGIIG